MNELASFARLRRDVEELGLLRRENQFACAILDMIALTMVFLSRKNGQDHVQ